MFRWFCRFAFHPNTHLSPILSFRAVYGNAGLTDQKHTGVVTLDLYRLSTSPFSILDFSHTIFPGVGLLIMRMVH
jgi:hypothetical protein